MSPESQDAWNDLSLDDYMLDESEAEGVQHFIESSSAPSLNSARGRPTGWSKRRRAIRIKTDGPSRRSRGKKKIAPPPRFDLIRQECPTWDHPSFLLAICLLGTVATALVIFS